MSAPKKGSIVVIKSERPLGRQVLDGAEQNVAELREVVERLLSRATMEDDGDVIEDAARAIVAIRNLECDLNELGDHVREAAE